MTRLTRLVLIASALLAIAPGPAVAQKLTLGRSPTGQPTRFTLAGAPYRLDGYRSARWGMDETAVRASIARDFPGATAPVAGDDAVNRTHFLSVDLVDLAPGTGTATITYVFGAQTRQLMAINLVWLRPGNPIPAERDRLITTGTQIVYDFMSGGTWQFPILRGVAAGPNMLVLFNATDDTGHGAELRISGIDYDYTINGKPAKSATATGPARLSLRLVADAKHPDVYRIKPGEF